MERSPNNKENPQRIESLLARIEVLERENEELEAMVGRDELTGLANRYHLEEKLYLMLDIAKRETDRGVFVLFLDLDGFKSINDSYGHRVGDDALKATAEALKSVVRGSDVVARFGGDEFVVSGFGDKAVGELVASKVLEAIQNVARGKNEFSNLGSSIGIADYPRCADNPNDLLKKADIAMYRAKKDGKGKIVSFDLENK